MPENISLEDQPLITNDENDPLPSEIQPFVPTNEKIATLSENIPLPNGLCPLVPLELGVNQIGIIPVQNDIPSQVSIDENTNNPVLTDIVNVPVTNKFQPLIPLQPINPEPLIPLESVDTQPLIPIQILPNKRRFNPVGEPLITVEYLEPVDTLPLLASKQIDIQPLVPLKRVEPVSIQPLFPIDPSEIQPEGLLEHKEIVFNLNNIKPLVPITQIIPSEDVTIPVCDTHQSLIPENQYENGPISLTNQISFTRTPNENDPDINPNNLAPFYQNENVPVPITNQPLITQSQNRIFPSTTSDQPMNLQMSIPNKLLATESEIFEESDGVADNSVLLFSDNVQEYPLAQEILGIEVENRQMLEYPPFLNNAAGTGTNDLPKTTGCPNCVESTKVNSRSQNKSIDTVPARSHQYIGNNTQMLINRKLKINKTNKTLQILTNVFEATSKKTVKPIIDSNFNETYPQKVQQENGSFHLHKNRTNSVAPSSNFLVSNNEKGTPTFSTQLENILKKEEFPSQIVNSLTEGSVQITESTVTMETERATPTMKPPLKNTKIGKNDQDKKVPYSNQNNFILNNKDKTGHNRSIIITVEAIANQKVTTNNSTNLSNVIGSSNDKEKISSEVNPYPGQNNGQTEKEPLDKITKLPDRPIPIADNTDSVINQINPNSIK